MTGTINANETLNGGVEAIPTLSGTLSGNTTSSYNSLSDKPIINGTTLEGGVNRSLVEDVVVAENYTSAQHNYTKGDYVLYETKLYRCIENTSGAWDSTKWEEVKLSNEVSDEVTLREELESATKVYGTPKNL
ncbi:hypothetical protein, partial [Sharpea azabuensis]|uniref:hypothetical protein n=1 Tax=Sharpea azabuensis TaxID=322505 RepID=UPI002E811408